MLSKAVVRSLAYYYLNYALIFLKEHLQKRITDFKLGF